MGAEEDLKQCCSLPSLVRRVLAAPKGLMQASQPSIFGFFYSFVVQRSCLFSPRLSGRVHPLYTRVYLSLLRGGLEFIVLLCPAPILYLLHLFNEATDKLNCKEPLRMESDIPIKKKKNRGGGHKQVAVFLFTDVNYL